MSTIKRLWVELYRPKSISEVIFQNDSQKKQFTNMVKDGEFPHLLLSGVQGSGKTTISKALVNDLNVDDMDILTINASDDNGVDTIREKVINFIQTYANGKFKVIQLEEMDFLTLGAQAILRNAMEEYSDEVRFIGTCNYENKIMPALKSRMQHFHFKAPQLEEVSVLAAEILIAEAIEFDIDTLDKYIVAAYPDIRKIINMLQQNSVDGILLSPNVNEVGDYKFKLLDLISQGDLKEIRKMVCSTVGKEEYEDVYRFMYDNIGKSKTFAASDKQEAAIVLIANYLYRNSICADPEINFAAMCIELGML